MAIAPVMCHLAEEVYEHCPMLFENKKPSVFHHLWPELVLSRIKLIGRRKSGMTRSFTRNGRH